MTLTLREELGRRIGARGRMTFAEFMELALYWPRGGYYRGESPIGVGADYFTAPSAHPAFGGLICLQIYQMWRILGRPDPFWLVEPGAGEGLLCRDVAEFAARLPGEFHRSLRYVCIDGAGQAGVEGAEGHRLAANGLPLRGVTGCIVSNELIDAFPVHMVERREGRLREVYVTLAQGRFAEELGEPSTDALQARLDNLDVRLEEGQRAEVNLAMGPWLRDAAQCLDRGYVITVDYGREAEELYSAQQRRRGTLTTFHRHVQTDDPFSRVGGQDMTAQVDFATLRRLGEEAGLETVGYLSQGRFLTNLGLRRWVARLAALGLDQGRRDANRAGMLQLARPGGMGDFRVLVQSKACPATPLWGVVPNEEAARIIDALPPPLLTARRSALL